LTPDQTTRSQLLADHIENEIDRFLAHEDELLAQRRAQAAVQTRQACG